MDIQLRAIEIQRHWPMAEWRSVVGNEPLEFREALTAELKVVCDRARAARAARQTLAGAMAASQRYARPQRHQLTQSQRDCLRGTS